MCATDCVDGQCASQVCEECGACTDLGTFDLSSHAKDIIST